MAAAVRLAGIPVRIEIGFPLVTVVLGLTGREGMLLVGWVVAVFVSVLVHELGHAVTLRAFGQRPTILLHGWGGATFPSGPLTPTRDVLVSLAGSTTAIVVVGIPALLVDGSIIPTSLAWAMFWSDLAWVSIGWSLVNLLPIVPLDGGNIARTFLARRFGDRGDLVGSWVSIGTCAVGAGWALIRGQPYVALWFGFFATYGGQLLAARRDEPSA
jgi:Zn-dependent protease